MDEGFLKGGYVGFFQFFTQHCFICCGSESNVLEDAGIESRTVATLALAVRRSNYTRIDLTHRWMKTKTIDDTKNPGL